MMAPKTRQQPSRATSNPPASEWSPKKTKVRPPPVIQHSLSVVETISSGWMPMTFSLPTRLRCRWRLWEKAKTRASYYLAPGRFFYRWRQTQFIPSALWCDLSPSEWFLRYMENDIYMQTATWLVSREVTEAAGPWDTRLLGDDDGEYFSAS